MVAAGTNETSSDRSCSGVALSDMAQVQWQYPDRDTTHGISMSVVLHIFPKDIRKSNLVVPDNGFRDPTVADGLCCSTCASTSPIIWKTRACASHFNVPLTPTSEALMSCTPIHTRQTTLQLPASQTTRASETSTATRQLTQTKVSKTRGCQGETTSIVQDVSPDSPICSNNLGACQPMDPGHI
jgi:hypothetical protein